ncbi:MAG: GreA/GreB family elongation factor [Patescibacteria group bacterium]|nr:GreA/GreB family elongation factor [Patescibacteria group bacterium]
MKKIQGKDFKNMAEEKKFYLTKKGLEKIKKGYQTLKKLKTAKIKGEVPKILESEDLNPEYLSFQEDLSLLESRIAELEYILKNAQLITPPPKEKQNIVNLGATVTLEDSDGEINEFMIVGTLEANPNEGKISSESPVGKSLLGHKIGDKVIITSPIKIVYRIKKIRYQSI